MRKTFGTLAVLFLAVHITGALCASGPEIDDDLFASKRVFPSIGPGLRAVRRANNGNYYVLASQIGVAIFDSNGKQLSVVAPPQSAPVTNKAGRDSISSAEDCDVDAKGDIYIADRGLNLVTEFSPDGQQIRAFPVSSLLSLAVLPDGEVAVSTLDSAHQVIIYGPDGKVTREFGDIESFSSRPDLNRFLNLGRVSSDPQGHIYYGFTYMPEPLVRQYDHLGKVTQEFLFTGVDAYPEASNTRKNIEKQENRTEPPSFHQILTAYGVDPVTGDVWMGLHNTLVHFDKEGNRASEYQIYAPKGAPIDATIILVEEQRLLIGADSLGVYEFRRPDRIR
jgi:hypothetical protein